MLFQESLKGVWSFKDVSRNLQECFKEVLWKLTESSRLFQGSWKGGFKEVSRVFKDVSGIFQGYFKSVLRACQTSFKEVSGGCQDISKICLGSLKGVRVFQRCFKEVSRKCSSCFKELSYCMTLIVATREDGGIVF